MICMEFSIATIIAIIPAGLLLYDAFGKREDLDDRGIFLYLITGFILGIPVSFFFLILLSNARDFIDLSIFLVLLFPFLNELLKFIVFNRNRFIKNKNAVYFSFSFSVGIGAMFSLSLIYYYGRSYSPGILDYIIFLIFSSMYVISNASTGILIGEGIFGMKRKYHLINAIIVQILAFLFLIPYMWSMIIYSTIGILIMMPIYIMARNYLK